MHIQMEDLGKFGKVPMIWVYRFSLRKNGTSIFLVLTTMVSNFLLKMILYFGLGMLS